MICAHCNTDTVEWIGPLADLGMHGTRCRSCGGMNCQRVDTPYPEEDGPCPSCRTGRLEYRRKGDCCCHINPPCSACTNAPLFCDACEWETEPADA